MNEHAPVFNLGRHLLAEFYECNANILNSVERIEDAMKEAAIACGATIVESKFHHFSPYGVSGVVIISESHLAIHTWPEYEYAAVDLFTCGESCDPHIAYEHLQKSLRSGNGFYSELTRGLLNNRTGELVHTPFVVQAHHESDRSGSVHPIRFNEQPGQPHVVKALNVKGGKAHV